MTRSKRRNTNRKPSPHTGLSQATDQANEKLDAILARLDEFGQTLVALSTAEPSVPSDHPTAGDTNTGLAIANQLDQLQIENQTLSERVDELVAQNEELAAQLAQQQVGNAVTQDMGVDESLSWEERRAMILQQMEADTFDADEFLETLTTQSETDPNPADTPIEYFDRLSRDLEESQQRLQDRDDEIRELRQLLEHQQTDAASQNHGDDVVTGAAAIAGLIDADELVQAERTRLQELKEQWEQKFRETEIAASLERAKLSRERQQIAKRATELEDQIDDLKRQQRDLAVSDTEPQGRRWLAELGLGRS